MESQRPTTPQSAKSSVDTRQAGRASQDVAVPPNARQSDDTYQPQSTTKTFLLLAGCRAMLDRMLMNSGQAIPQITDEFHSLPDVGCCCLENYTPSTPSKPSCSRASFIIRRAIASVGAAGIFAGCKGARNYRACSVPSSASLRSWGP
ncbi:hypothetical protein B0J12DRAFT_699040 [Macrophomina phaseolina]|uniref:Beta-lactamase-related domain-containing protein n=1 Tax=Macrophomina phaseolina TaxID=35725 RepID=A0ABQ8GE29_9PEZI|nr:hypothetical protein B0J12DRAFT_699040 [Macrophomina phaseolina]